MFCCSYRTDGILPQSIDFAAAKAQTERNGFQRVYRVDLTPRELLGRYELPSRELARSFRADLKLTVQVADAAKVVEERIADASALEQVLRLPLRQIGRSHASDEPAQVEEKMHAFLTNRTLPELGLRIVRAGVSVDLEGAALEHEREKIEHSHRRQLEEFDAMHRRQLERVDAMHRRELDREREDYNRMLESARTALYEDIVGEGLLPRLFLLKLATRAPGDDSKELNEVIDKVTQLRVENFKVPLELLDKYTDLVAKSSELTELKEPVNELLKHLVATFGPQAVSPLFEESFIEEESVIEVGDSDDD